MRSPSKYQEFCKNTLPLCGLKKRKFKLDIKTRWNSTYLMLASDANCSNALVTYVNYKLGEGSITAYNWNIAFKFLKFFKVFYDATLACSTIYKPYISKVLSHLHNINE